MFICLSRYVLIYSIALVIFMVAMIYLMLMQETLVIKLQKQYRHLGLDETRAKAEVPKMSCSTLKELGDISHVKRGISTAIKKRPNKMRHIVIMLIT